MAENRVLMLRHKFFFTHEAAAQAAIVGARRCDGTNIAPVGQGTLAQTAPLLWNNFLVILGQRPDPGAAKVAVGSWAGVARVNAAGALVTWSLVEGHGVAPRRSHESGRGQA